MNPQVQFEQGREISVRALQESDLNTADHIMRLAFGTFLGLPEPTAFMGDASYVRTRWKANPDAAFVAEINNRLIGSNFATDWGSVGFFGPLTIHPELWNSGAGKRLMEPIMQCFEVGNKTRRSLHFCPKSEARWSLSKIRFLSALSHCNHVEGGGPK